MTDDLTKRLIRAGLQTVFEHHRDDIATHARRLRKQSKRAAELANTLDTVLRRLESLTEKEPY